MSDPIAYFITFRTYGTWLHGDERGSVDRDHNTFATPSLGHHTGRERSARQRLKNPPVSLNEQQRAAIQDAITRVCVHREWSLHAINVRTNHVHLVVSAEQSPELVMQSLKSWASRTLRENDLLDQDERVWARHGSTRYLWKAHQLTEACRYVVEGQGVEE